MASTDHLTNSHYYLEHTSSSYAIFNSRWDEFLLVDRISKLSVYAYGEVGAELHMEFSEAARMPNNNITFNMMCAEYLSVAGETVKLSDDVLRGLNV